MSAIASPRGYGSMDQLPSTATLPVPGSVKVHSVALRLREEVDPKQCQWVSVYACFLTGFTSAISFTACFIWPGFQTGNVAQLAIAMARTFDPPETRTVGFQKSDQQALTALISFWLGTSLGRIGDRLGNKRRDWLVSTVLIQMVMASAAAVLARYSGEGPYGADRMNPSWATPMGMAALAFLSASLGLQGIVGKRIGSAMNTTVVLTTTWVEIFNDPSLFVLRYVPSRDMRIAGVVSVLVGAFIARALLGVIGGGGTVAVLVGLRAIQGCWWAILPVKP